jgi:hypothetical protein
MKISDIQWAKYGDNFCSGRVFFVKEAYLKNNEIYCSVWEELPIDFDDIVEDQYGGDDCYEPVVEKVFVEEIAKREFEKKYIKLGGM